METNKKAKKDVKKRKLVLAFLLIILIFWGALSLYQILRYDIDSYNCSDMSRDCAGFFKKIGIPTEIVYGVNKYDDSSRHCWVRLFGCIDFESTCLFFKVTNRYYVTYVEEV